MIRRLSRLSTAALLALALGLTACSGGGNTRDGSGDRAPTGDSDRLPPDQDPEMKTKQPESEKPSDDGSGGATDNPDPLPDTTAPGTKLKAGESAIIQVATGDNKEQGSAYLEYTVTAVDEGDVSVLKTLGMDNVYEETALYYIRGKVKVLALVGDAVDAETVGGSMTGIGTPGTQEAMPELERGQDPNCVDTFIMEAPKVGKEMEACIPVISIPDAPPVEAAFIDDDYDESPIRWSLS